MNKYFTTCHKIRLEGFFVEAKTPLEAQEKALPVFQKSTRKKLKRYDVNAVLIEKDGDTVAISLAAL